MGLEAQLFAIGPFTKEIADCLDYNKEYYEDTKEGATVTSRFFMCVSSFMSAELAEAVGCDVWDFNTHNVTYNRFNEPIFAELDYEGTERTQLNRLIKAGFTILYMPGG